MADNAVVHIIDDDIVIRQSLGFLLATEGLSVRLYESSSVFLIALSAFATLGCIVIDVRMPGVDGIELLSRLNARHCKLPVIVMTGHADVTMAVESMKRGAFDIVEKPFDDKLFLTIVHAALRFASKAGVGSDDPDAEIKARMAQLSGRERQVLIGLLAGKMNKVIATDLGISPRTVEIYRANVMTKMKAHSLSELIRMSILDHNSGRIPQAHDAVQ